MAPEARTMVVRLGSWGLIALATLTLMSDRSSGQAPASEPGAKPAAQPSQHQVDQAKEELALLQLQLEAKESLLRIGEARLEDAKRWKTHFEGLLRAGRVTEDRVMSAADDVRMLEAHVTGEKADVKLFELRVKQAKRAVEQGERPAISLERRLMEMEERLARSEVKIDILQHEIGRLKREAPKETRYGPR